MALAVFALADFAGIAAWPDGLDVSRPVTIFPALVPVFLFKLNTSFSQQA